MLPRSPTPDMEWDVAHWRRRRPENQGDDFFVDASCIDCDQCRRIAPRIFQRRGEQSAVVHQPQDSDERRRALMALVTCPTASIGTRQPGAAREVLGLYPEPIEEDVLFCGFAAESSFGASSYLIRRPEGNVLVDVPRFAGPLVRRIEALGGVHMLFLTHRDDVADHAKWARHFGARRILHRLERSRRQGTDAVEQFLSGEEPLDLAPDLRAIPTPGHTAGHTVLLFRQRFLFSGDHLWFSERRGSLVASRSVCWYSWPQQLRSVQRLLQFPFEWVLPGHGQRLHAPWPIMRQQLQAIGKGPVPPEGT